MQILDEVLELPQDLFGVPSPHIADPTRRRYLTPAFVVKLKVETVAGIAECPFCWAEYLVRENFNKACQRITR